MISYLLKFGFPPALIFIIGALFIPVLKGRIKSAFMLLLPVLAFITLVNVPEGKHWIYTLMDYDLILGRVDRLSRIFGYIFTLISFISVLFALKVDDDVQHTAGLVYAGSALGVTFSGDFFSLYIFWELMAVASTFLILARKTKASQAAAFRYVMVHVFGGLCLLAGIIIYIHKTGSAEFGFMELKGIESYLIFAGIAVNAAIPPLHPWLQDAYPEATVTGAVFLSAFTTKSAVYVMARIFPGAELLIWLGALMTAIPIFYAVLENDIRRVLAYSLINQVGFMMCGIGIGTQLAINGAVSHAFCHILYKALLFMAAGSVLHMTGKIRCTDLGGLYKTMPLTCLFCIIGAASISAFPFFSGFVSKSMIVSAAAHNKLAVVWLMLQFASAGVFHHAGIKVPYFTFFSHDSGVRAKEPPLNMLIAMGIAAFLCVFIGIFPKPLYSILPYPVDYVPYTGAHVVGQLQLLMFGALAFCLLILSGNYPAEMRAINLDTDWFYRKGSKAFSVLADKSLNSINSFCDMVFVRKLTEYIGNFSRNGPARLALIFMLPFQPLLKEDIRKKVYSSFETGSIPIGISAALATLFITVLIFLT
ncbi:MAG: Na(+)/H(+) antiporter subunit D [Desulfobacteraceae bacterium]|nr:Na(+)/H(+) antiporter subunit D [Desulfobacteraceae bacterium]